MSGRECIIYGANGYTGELVAREAARRGLAPVLAGRNREAVARLAGELGLTSRAFGLDDPRELAVALADTAAVLHCAGPFMRTSRPMAEACLAAGAHYLDITGEIAVFESLLRRGTEARQAGICLLPGVGFDVVPSDCLAARLAAALPEASALDLAIHGHGGAISRGTLKTMIQSLPAAGAVRRGGRIVAVPLAFEAREIPFSCGPRWAMTIAWGDVSTAFHSTGIPDIRVFAGTPRRAVRRLRALAPLLPVAGTAPVKRLLSWWVDRTRTGPDEPTRAAARMYLWGEARSPEGESVAATLETPEGYSFTAAAAVECLLRVLAGRVEPGAWTPSRAFGAGLAREIPGVVEGPLERRGSAPAAPAS